MSLIEGWGLAFEIPRATARFRPFPARPSAREMSGPMGDMRIGRRGSGETRAGSLGNPVGGNSGKPDVMGKPGKRAETRTAREISFGIRDHQMVAERGRPSATSRATLVERIFEVILL